MLRPIFNQPEIPYATQLLISLHWLTIAAHNKFKALTVVLRTLDQHPLLHRPVPFSAVSEWVSDSWCLLEPSNLLYLLRPFNGHSLSLGLYAHIPASSNCNAMDLNGSVWRIETNSRWGLNYQRCCIARECRHLLTKESFRQMGLVAFPEIHFTVIFSPGYFHAHNYLPNAPSEHPVK